MKNTITKHEFALKHDPPADVRHLKSHISKLQKQLDSEKETRGHLQTVLSDILEAVPQCDPLKSQYKEPKKDTNKSQCSHVIHLTDWHIGQITKSEYIEEFGENNYAAHEARVQTLLEKVINKTRLQRSSYNVDEAVVIHTGDYVSGDIHQELLTTNEFPTPVAAVKAGFLLGWFLENLAPHFKTVRAHLMTTDNHGRITRKPQCEDGGLNNWGYVSAHIAGQRVRKLKNVEVNIHPTLSQIIPVGPEKYLTSHGDGILGTWGIPFYGIERKKQREAMARLNMEESKKFTKILIGHFHTALNHEHWLIGGSLTGTTAYDHKEGRHARPHQTSWLVHPTHGEFDWTRWYLE